MTKHLFYPLLWSAAAVLALSACQREPEVVPDNPTYDAEANTVTTQFMLNVSTNTGKDTKTTAKYAQVNGNFLGMTAVHLLTYHLEYGDFFYDPYEASAKSTRDYDLGSLFAAGDVTADRSSRTLELAFPLETNCVVLYGKTVKESSDDLQGSVVASGDPKDLNSLTFSLQPRLSSKDGYDGFTFLMSRMLNYFVSAGLVKETSFWANPTGTTDNSYAFWWPIDENTPTNPGSADGDTQSVNNDRRIYTYHKGQLSWKQLGRMYDYFTDDPENGTEPEDVFKNLTDPVVGLSPLGETLGEAYSALTTVRTGTVMNAEGEEITLKELRSGSGSALLRTMDDLYAIVNKASTTTATSWEEQVAKLLAIQITGRMEEIFEMGTDGHLRFLTDAEGAVNVAKIKENLETKGNTTDWNTNKAKIDKVDAKYFPSTYNEGFPINVGLPYGAAVLQCTQEAALDKVDKFSYQDEIPAYGMNEGTFPIYNYRYPAELMYYGNSAIRVSDDVMTLNNFPGSVSAWASPTSWTGWSENGAAGKVSSTTRSVAMMKTINYGTALLKSTVKYASGITYLEDNNKAMHPQEDNNHIEINNDGNRSNKGLIITGIVVGGQPDVVGWDFTRQGDNKNNAANGGWKWDAENQLFTDITFADNPMTKMIYDKVGDANNTYLVGGGEPIYTMVWDNYDATLAADKQSDVYVAVEFVNDTGSDFWGEMNLVRQGGTFYLIGKMDIAAALDKVRANNSSAFTSLARTDYNYPPFNPETGETINAPRVFMQDYMTTANLILDQTSLQHAYVTVPDLRASQVTMGVAIDLEWEAGLAFDVEMGHTVQ